MKNKLLPFFLSTALLLPFACSDEEPLDTPRANQRATVLTVLESLFDEGDISVIEQYFGDTYTQHNPSIPNGTDALRGFVGQLDTSTTTHTAYRVASQGDLVAVQSHITFDEGDRGMATMDIFRFEDSRIVEHWDVVQPVPETSKSGHGMFDGEGGNTTTLAKVGDEDANIALVTKLYAEVFNQGKLEVIDELVAPGYVQHSPDFEDGREGLRGGLGFFLETFPDLHLEPIRFVAEGNLVFVHVHITFAKEDQGKMNTGSAGIDVFRIQDGLLVEHWDALQEVVAETASGNSMF